jgi:hypothetical protein
LLSVAEETALNKQGLKPCVPLIQFWLRCKGENIKNQMSTREIWYRYLAISPAVMVVHKNMNFRNSLGLLFICVRKIISSKKNSFKTILDHSFTCA